MPVVAALLESRAAALALRRSLPKDGPGVVNCRGMAGLRRTLEARLVDAIVLSPHPGLMDEVAHLIAPHVLLGWDTGGEAWEP